MNGFRDFCENRDRDQMKRLGLSGMQLSKLPHRGYDKRSADRKANSQEILARKDSESNRERSLGMYYSYGLDHKERQRISEMEGKVNEFTKKLGLEPPHVNWNYPDPYALLAVADWMEENGEESGTKEELRNYATSVAKKLGFDRKTSIIRKRDMRWQERDPFADDEED